jgi:hypothetical protein
LDEGADLVIGSRYLGKIQTGAMPFLHRYLGTPVLTTCVNFLHASSGTRLTDCNAGFRAFRRSSFEKLTLESTGMEFASEMLVQALRKKLQVREVPVALRASHPHRTPHLRTWRDGMRHLLRIFLESPEFFRVCGLFIFVLSWFALLLGALYGPVTFLGFSIFGLHSMLFGVLGAEIGVILWGMGLALAASAQPGTSAYAALLEVDEGHLFWSLVACGVFEGVLLGAIVLRWAQQDFQFLDLEKFTVVVVTLATNMFTIGAQVFLAHMLKRRHS